MYIGIMLTLLGYPDSSRSCALPSRERGFLGRTWLGLALLCASIGCQPESPISEELGLPEFTETSSSLPIPQSSDSWGISWFDVNQDLRPDLYLGNHRQAPRLLLGVDGGFVHAPAGMLPEPTLHDAHGAVWADFDGDGNPDLLELVGANGGTSSDSPNQLFHNSGDTLQEEAEEWGLDLPSDRGRTPLWVDWDSDGDLDVVLSNKQRADQPSRVLLQEGGTFQDGPILSENSASFARHSDFTQDGVLDVGLFAEESTPVLFMHTSEGYIPIDHPISTVSDVQDIATGDFDGDGTIDLFLTRRGPPQSDVVQLDDGTIWAALYSQDVEEGFRFEVEGTVQFDLEPEVVAQLTTTWVGTSDVPLPASSSLQLSSDDPQVHGLPDTSDLTAYVAIGYDPNTRQWTVLSRFHDPSLSNSDLQIRVTSVGGQELGTPEPIGFSIDDPNEALIDELWLAGSGEWTNVSTDSGLDVPTACAGSTAADFDNDGDLDVYQVCASSIQNVPNRLWVNDGNAHFVDVAMASNAAGPSAGLADAVAAADYDSDGLMDLLVSNGRWTSGPYTLLNNTTNNPGHWLEIRLVGSAPNLDAIGARVYARAGDKVWVREQGGGVHHRAQDDPRLHFGLGSTSLLDELEIIWPDGSSELHTDVEVDQVLSIGGSAWE